MSTAHTCSRHRKEPFMEHTTRVAIGTGLVLLLLLLVALLWPATTVTEGLTSPITSLVR